MTLEPQMGLTFEQVWATIQSIAEQHKETDRTVKELAEQHKELAEQHKETERFLKESKAENERFLKESKADTDRMIQELQLSRKQLENSVKRLNQKMGDVDNRLGELVQSIISPNLIHKFYTLGYDIKLVYPNVPVYDEQHRTATELDLVLQNGTDVIAVEVKTKLTMNHVIEHRERMALLARVGTFAGKHLYGAVAGAILTEEVKRFAFNEGFFVLEQSGDTVNIAATPETWKPKRW